MTLIDRIQFAIRETEALINKEESYSVDLQDTSKLAVYRSHLEKLKNQDSFECLKNHKFISGNDCRSCINFRKCWPSAL